MFRFATDVNALPGLLAPFDRIVIATGADYRFGLGGIADWLLAPTWRARRAWRGCSPGRRCATGSTIARAAPPARASGLGGAGPKSRGHRRRGAGRQKQAGDNQRLRSGVAARLESNKLPNSRLTRVGCLPCFLIPKIQSGPAVMAEYGSLRFVDKVGNNLLFRGGAPIANGTSRQGTAGQAQERLPAVAIAAAVLSRRHLPVASERRRQPLYRA